MSANFDDFDDSESANKLKAGMVIVTDPNVKEYIKVTNIDKVKTGKHGAAKVMVTGKNVRTGNKAEAQFTGSTKVPIVLPSKSTYMLIELDEEEDCLYVEPITVTGQGEMMTLQLNEIDKSGVELIKTAYSSLNKEDDVLSFVTMSYPGLLLIDSVKTVSKKAMASKSRSAAPAA